VLRLVSALLQPRNLPRPRLGFLGLGWIGRQRMEALGEEVERVVFADADLELARRLAAESPGTRTARSLDELLVAGVDGVVIATPSGLHEAQAISALDGGLAVFCQKPLATCAAGATRVIDAAQATDRLLGVDFCYRHVAGMAELRERLRAREFGDILAIDLAFHNAYAPSAAWCRDRSLAGGGCLLDLGVHLVDLVLWLQDFPALQVQWAQLRAQGHAPRSNDVEDFACASLRQAGGAIIRLACSWQLHAGQGALIELALYGTRGGAAWRNVAGSFYDFEIHTQLRDRRTLLARDGGNWATGALRAWTGRLAQRQVQFQPEARQYAAAAAVIDSIYQAADGETDS
jgi:predicted dehydrogenase